MTVWGIPEKVVSRVRDDRLADRLSGRLALRHAYREFRRGRNSLPGRPVIAYQPSGAPYLPAAPGTFCSISHSCRHGVAAVGSTPLGIDIEQIRPRDRNLLRYIATDDEVAGLRELVDDPNELLTLIWVLKEAAAKASGRGMALAVRQSQVRVRQDGSFEVAGWSVISYRYDRFVIGLACQQSAQDRPAIRWYQPGRVPAPEVPPNPRRIETVRTNSV
jgi:phosphopantetheinyl transferase